VRRERRLARRGELQSARFDRPRLRVAVVEVDRRHAHDLAVFDIHENRPAIRHVAIAHDPAGKRRAESPADRLAHHDGLGKPVGEILGAVDRELEVLLRIDLIEPVDRRHEQRRAELRVLESEDNVGLRMHPRPRRALAVANGEPAADLFITRFDLRDEVALTEAHTERRISPRLVGEDLCQAEQNGPKFQRRKQHIRLRLERILQKWSPVLRKAIELAQIA
jgi:hypothetical protein